MGFRINQGAVAPVNTLRSPTHYLQSTWLPRTWNQVSLLQSERHGEWEHMGQLQPGAHALHTAIYSRHRVLFLPSTDTPWESTTENKRPLPLGLPPPTPRRPSPRTTCYPPQGGAINKSFEIV